MLFYKHPKASPKLNILVNGIPIDLVKDFNYIGITLDQHNYYLKGNYLKGNWHDIT